MLTEPLKSQEKHRSLHKYKGFRKCLSCFVLFSFPFSYSGSSLAPFSSSSSSSQRLTFFSYFHIHFHEISSSVSYFSPPCLLLPLSVFLLSLTTTLWPRKPSFSSLQASKQAGRIQSAADGSLSPARQAHGSGDVRATAVGAFRHRKQPQALGIVSLI